MARIIMIDDEDNQFDVTDRINEIVEESQELAEENEQLEKYLEEVAASFGEAEDVQEGIALSNDAFSLIAGQGLELANSGTKMRTQKLGASKGAEVNVKGAIKPKTAAKIAGFQGNGTGAAAMKKGLRGAKSATVGSKVMGAAKGFGRFAKKAAGSVGGKAAIGAGLGAIAGTGAVAMLKRNKTANANTSSRIQASNDQLQLDIDPEEGELEGEYEYEELTQEEFDELDPEEQQAVIDEQEQEETEELAEYANNVMISDAESRTPKVAVAK